jgi:hypothetical protein
VSYFKRLFEDSTNTILRTSTFAAISQRSITCRNGPSCDGARTPASLVRASVFAFTTPRLAEWLSLSAEKLDFAQKAPVVRPTSLTAVQDGLLCSQLQG